MLVARMYDKNDIRLEEIAIPQIGSDEMLVKVRAAAICGTDVRMFRNGVKGVDENNPLILCHEIAGDICEIGKEVKDYKIGQRVAIAPNFGCGVCDLCVSGRSHLCKTYKAFGINIDGGFAEYVKIPGQAIRSGNITLIPENVSYNAAAANEPLSCAFNGSERANIKPGDVVVIIGAGPIGVMHALLAKMAGAGKVIVNDLSEERLAVCKKTDPSIITVLGDIKTFAEEITKGKGVDVCITACPSPEAQKTAMEICGLNGRINFFGGIPAAKEPVAIDTNLIHYKQLIISGTTRASLEQFRKTLSFISDGIIDADALITDVYPLSRIHEAMENAAGAKGLKHVIEF